MFLRLLPVREILGGGGSQGIFCGDNEIIAIGRDKITEQFLGLAELVAVGGVDEVAAGFDVTIEDFFRFRALGAMSPARAEVAGAQRQFGDAQPGLAAEDFVSHSHAPRFQAWRGKFSEVRSKTNWRIMRQTRRRFSGSRR